MRLWKRHPFLWFSLTCAEGKGEEQVGVWEVKERRVEKSPDRHQDTFLCMDKVLKEGSYH